MQKLSNLLILLQDNSGKNYNAQMYTRKIIRGGADKSLARPTSRCHRTESIVSLERGGLLMCRIASLFLLQRLKGSMSGDARDFNNMETQAVIKFFFLFFPPTSSARQGAEGNLRHSD